MKAILFEEFGGPEVLQFKDIPCPEIGPNQLLIRVHAAGVNPADWKMREGYLATAFPHQLPVIPGWEMAGTVEKTGEQVKGIEPGQHVYCYNRLEKVQYGTYAEFSIADAGMVAPMPANLDFVTAASIPLTALTAWQALVSFAKLNKDETVLITAGAGGVGGFAIQIAKYLGAGVCSTASKNNHEYLQGLGADVIIDYNTENIKSRILEFTPDGVDVVLDCTGSEDVAINFDYVKKGTGRVVTINGLLNTVPVLEEKASEFAVKAGLVFVEPDGGQLKEISRLLEEQLIKPLPVKVFPLEEAGSALMESEQGHVRGKLVLQVC